MLFAISSPWGPFFLAALTKQLKDKLKEMHCISETILWRDTGRTIWWEGDMEKTQQKTNTMAHLCSLYYKEENGVSATVECRPLVLDKWVSNCEDIDRSFWNFDQVLLGQPQPESSGPWQHLPELCRVRQFPDIPSRTRAFAQTSTQMVGSWWSSLWPCDTWWTAHEPWSYLVKLLLVEKAAKNWSSLQNSCKSNNDQWSILFRCLNNWVFY